MFHNQCKSSLQPHGFQLLELLLTLCILGIVLGMGFYYGARPSLSAKHIAYELGEIVQAARMFALETGETVYFSEHINDYFNELQLFTIDNEDGHKTLLREYKCNHCKIQFIGLRPQLFFDARGDSHNNNGTFYIHVGKTSCKLILNTASRSRIEC